MVAWSGKNEWTKRLFFFLVLVFLKVFLKFIAFFLLLAVCFLSYVEMCEAFVTFLHILETFWSEVVGDHICWMWLVMPFF